MPTTRPLSAHDWRDTDAGGRDWEAKHRDMAANANSWLDDDEQGEALADREAAEKDRKDAKADRLSSSVNRALLTEDDDPETECPRGAPDRNYRRPRGLPDRGRSHTLVAQNTTAILLSRS